MNILTDMLPRSVTIDDVEYEIDTDFRTALTIITAFEDPELASHEKMWVMVQLLYKDIPHDISKACEMAVKFLDCGEEGKVSGDTRTYSFTKDAKYIYTGIHQTHRIDLQSVEYLHWWKFVYLFMDLSADCMFSKILDLRIRRAKGKLTKEEKAFVAEISDILDLPSEPARDEVSDEFMRLLKGG